MKCPDCGGGCGDDTESPARRCHDCAEARVELLDGLVREIEWKGHLIKDHACPSCRGLKPKHQPSCRLVLALSVGS